MERDDLAFADWPDEIRRSRVGVDLRIRGGATPWLYGRSRPLAERWIAGSRDLALAGLGYFAGDRVPRIRLAGAALALAGAWAGDALAGAREAATSSRRAAWW